MKEKKEELSEMVKSILESYEQHDIICNIDSTNRLNRKTIVELIDASYFRDILRCAI